MKLTINSSIKLLNGKKMPLLGLGTWKSSGLEAEEAVYNAIKIGYRNIDTAHIYGNEEDVGRGIRRAMEDFKIKRSELFVTTKLWNSDHGDPLDAFNKSLTKLQLDYIDLYLIHWPVPQRINSWKTLQPLLKTGKCMSLGVSNFTIDHLNEMIKHKLSLPVVNQVEFSPFLYQKELLDFCKKHKVVLEAYSPLAHGERLNDSVVKEIGRKHEKSPAQVLLRWALQHDIPVIPKSVNIERIKENSELYNFKLTEKEMEELDNLNEDFRTCWDPTKGTFVKSVVTGFFMR